METKYCPSCCALWGVDEHYLWCTEQSDEDKILKFQRLSEAYQEQRAKNKELSQKIRVLQSRLKG